MSFETWMAFVLGAVLSWGIYVPVLHQGQASMGGADGPSAGAVRAFLCVGIAYFVTAVVIPLIALYFGLADGEPLNFTKVDPDTKESVVNTRAIVFSTMGGIAGAAGALCIIFSIKSGGSPLYIPALVFAGAPIVNVIVTLTWHRDKVKSFSEATPGWIMFSAGILLAAVGAGLVLFSKGYIEVKKGAMKKAPPAAVAQVEPNTGIQPGQPPIQGPTT